MVTGENSAKYECINWIIMEVCMVSDSHGLLPCRQSLPELGPSGFPRSDNCDLICATHSGLDQLPPTFQFLCSILNELIAVSIQQMPFQCVTKSRTKMVTG
jgi:hypothetical protein